MRANPVCRWLQVGLLCLASGWTACSRPEAEAATAGGEPRVLRVGFTPSEEGTSDREQAQQALADYLGVRFGFPVELVRTASYGPAMQAMAAGEIDLMALAPFAYVLAAKQGIAEALVVIGTESEGPRTYESVLLTHERTGLKSLDEIRDRAGELRFNFVDPASNSGFLVPQAKLVALGVDPSRDLGGAEFTLSHGVAILNVAVGRADLAGVSLLILERLLTKQRVSGEGFRVLWRSEKLPLGPVAVRSGLSLERKQTLKRYLLELATFDPVTAEVVMRQYAGQGLRYLPCDEVLFASLRRLSESAEKKAE